MHSGNVQRSCSHHLLGSRRKLSVMKFPPNFGFPRRFLELLTRVYLIDWVEWKLLVRGGILILQQNSIKNQRDLPAQRMLWTDSETLRPSNTKKFIHCHSDELTHESCARWSSHWDPCFGWCCCYCRRRCLDDYDVTVVAGRTGANVDDGSCCGKWRHCGRLCKGAAAFAVCSL